jgi:hypothetical protein
MSRYSLEAPLRPDTASSHARCQTFALRAARKATGRTTCTTNALLRIEDLVPLLPSAHVSSVSCYADRVASHPWTQGRSSKAVCQSRRQFMRRRFNVCWSAPFLPREAFGLRGPQRFSAAFQLSTTVMGSALTSTGSRHRKSSRNACTGLGVHSGRNVFFLSYSDSASACCREYRPQSPVTFSGTAGP